MEDCRADEIGKVSAAKRTELASALVENSVRLGPRFRLALLEATAQDLPTEEMLEALRPWSLESAEESEADYDPRAPKLAHIKASERDAASVILKVVIYVHTVRLMKQNEAGASDMLAFSKAVLQWLQSRPSSSSSAATSTTPILDAALEELRVAMTFFDAITPPIHTKMNAGMDAVSTLRNAAFGSLHLLKTALKQCPYWSKLEAQFRTLELANQTTVPELLEACSLLKSEGFGHVEKVLKQAPKWLDAVGRELCGDVLASLSDVMKAKLDSLVTTDLEPWPSVLAVFEKAADLCDTPALQSLVKTGRERYNEAKRAGLENEAQSVTDRVLQELCLGTVGVIKYNT